MNRNQVKGRVTKAKGKTKAVAGKLLRKPSLAAKGKIEAAAGMVQLSFGDMQAAAKKGATVVKRAARKAGKTLKKVPRAARPVRKAVKKAAAKARR